MTQNDHSQGGGAPLFSAKVECMGTMSSVLKAVAFCEKVNLFINPNGLKFTVEEGKYVQASIFMQKNMFQEFVVNEEEVHFKMPLKELLECLKIFLTDGKSNDTTLELNNCSLTLMYRSPGSAFEVLLEENGMLTDFQLKTEEVDDLMEFDIDPVSCKILMKADLFFDLLAEIDSNGPENIEIDVTEEMMSLKGKGVAGHMEVSIPAKAFIVEYFECMEACKAYYRLAILKYAFKALQIGQKVSLKMNSHGVLSLSFLIESKADSFVEFYCIPLHGNPDEDEGNVSTQ